VIESFEVLLESTYYIKNEEMLSPLFEQHILKARGLTFWIGEREVIVDFHYFPLKSVQVCCYDRLQESLPRTNNKIEGWHNGFSAMISHTRPIIWEFIESLKKEGSLNKIIIEQIISGHVPCKKKI